MKGCMNRIGVDKIFAKYIINDIATMELKAINALKINNLSFEFMSVSKISYKTNNIKIHHKLNPTIPVSHSK